MRIIANNFIEASVQLLNTEVPFADFKSDNGLNIIKSFEGLSLVPYICPAI